MISVEGLQRRCLAAAAIDWVRDAFGHLKVIGHTLEAQPLFAKAGLADDLATTVLLATDKPVLIADIAGFWRPLLSLFAHMREQGFIRAGFELRYLVAEKIDDVLPMLQRAAVRSTETGAWLSNM